MSVWLKGEEGKKPTRPEYFLSKLTKMFYSQIGEKIRKNINGLHHPRAAVLLLIVNGVLLLFSFFSPFDKQTGFAFFFFFFFFSFVIFCSTATPFLIFNFFHWFLFFFILHSVFIFLIVFIRFLFL